jgi:hypothetical protein
MKQVKAHITAPFWCQASLPFLWIALLLAAPYLVTAGAAPSQDGPITEGVYLSEVTLESFTATWIDNQMAVDWTTRTELYNAGFNLYRAEHNTHRFVRLNDALIPSQAAEGSGGTTYEFIDGRAMVSATYDYWLESVDMQGLPRYLGTISSEVPGDEPPAPSRLCCHVFLPMVSR